MPFQKGNNFASRVYKRHNSITLNPLPRSRRHVVHTPGQTSTPGGPTETEGQSSRKGSLEGSPAGPRGPKRGRPRSCMRGRYSADGGSLSPANSTSTGSSRSTTSSLSPVVKGSRGRGHRRIGTHIVPKDADYPGRSGSAPATGEGKKSIRTRLSTGSIQMNGTTTVSAAREARELETIMKQISKAENQTTSPALGKKRGAGVRSADGGLATHPPPKKRKIGRNDGTGEDNRNDYFCWLCHKEGTVICCELCPRVYHSRCLSVDNDLPSDWVCPECEKIMRAECIETRSKAMEMLTLDQLCTLLKYALLRMKHEGSDPFQMAVDMAAVPSYTDYIFNPMDLSTLEANIKKKMYGCTEAFLADAKWILHNCIIYNGSHDKLTNGAKMIIRICKHEMNEIELCPDCYKNSCIRNDDEWFSEPCRKPHTLVWAKLKGYPFWPAKALRESEGQVDVRFFGAHDRSWVPVSQCFMLSLDIPTSLSKGKKSAGMDNAMKELDVHIDKIRAKLGQDAFEYAPYRTPYDRNNCYKAITLNPKSPFRKKAGKGKKHGKFPGTAHVEKSGPNILRKTASAVKNKYRSSMAQQMGRKGNVTGTPEKLSEVKQEFVPDYSARVSMQHLAKEVLSDTCMSDGDVKPDTNVKPDTGSMSKVEFKPVSSSSSTVSSGTKVATESRKSKPVSYLTNTGIIEKLETKIRAMQEVEEEEKALEIKQEVVEEIQSENGNVVIACTSEQSHKENVDNSDECRRTDKDKKSDNKSDSVKVTIARGKVMAKTKGGTEQNKEKVDDVEVSEVDSPSKEVYLKKLENTILSCKAKLGLSETEEVEDAVDEASDDDSIHLCMSVEEEEEEVDGETKELDKKVVSQDSQSSSTPDSVSSSARDSQSTSSSAQDSKSSNAEDSQSTSGSAQDSQSTSSSAQDSQSSGVPDSQSSSDMEKGLKEQPVTTDTVAKVQKESPSSKSGKTVLCTDSENDVDRLSSSDRRQRTDGSEKSKDTGSRDSITSQSGNSGECVRTGDKVMTETTKKEDSVSVLPSPSSAVKSLFKSGSDGAVPMSSSSEQGAVPAQTTSEMKLNTQAQPSITERKEPLKLPHSKTPASQEAAEDTPLFMEVDEEIETETDSDAGRLMIDLDESDKDVTLTPSKDRAGKVTTTSNTCISGPSQLPTNSSGFEMSVKRPGEESQKTKKVKAPCIVPLMLVTGDEPLSLKSKPKSESKKKNKIKHNSPVLSPKLPAVQQTAVVPDPIVTSARVVSPDQELSSQSSGSQQGEVNKQPSSAADADFTTSKIAEKFSKKILTAVQKTFDEMYSEMMTETSQSEISGLQKQLEQTHWNYAQELTEMKHNFQLSLKEMKMCWEAEKQRMSKELRASYDKEREEEVKEVKKKQWCANCGKEAIFYCCWNTSYCDYPCQQVHWPSHMHSCLQTNAQGKEAPTKKSDTQSPVQDQGQGQGQSSKERSRTVSGGSNGRSSIEAKPVPASSSASSAIDVEAYRKKVQDNITQVTQRQNDERQRFQTAQHNMNAVQFVPRATAPPTSNLQAIQQISQSPFSPNNRTPQIMMPNNPGNIYINQQVLRQNPMQLHPMQVQRTSLAQSRPLTTGLLQSQTVLQGNQNPMVPMYPVVQQQAQQYSGPILFTQNASPQRHLVQTFGNRPPF